MANRTKTLALCALGVALTLALTLISMPLPGGHGYVHLGDIPVLLFPLLILQMLPASENRVRMPYFAALAVAIGAAGADLSLGYAIYMPTTLLIKAAAAVLALFLFCRLPQKLRFFAPLIASLLVPFGYLGYELLLYGKGAFASVPLNALQGIVGAAGAWAAYIPLKYAIAKRKDR